MRVLGIDPGLAIVGYAIVEMRGSDFIVLEYGCLTTSSKSSSPDRLHYIYQELLKIIDEFEPDEMAIEELFFNQNTKTAIKVAEARGVEILAGRTKGLRVYEYTPLQIKMAITGYGRAEKMQVQLTLQNILRLKDIPQPDDAADALAVSITHCFSHRFKEEFLMK